MDTETIRYFLTVAELGSFGRAAQILNLTQPTLSRRIALLEREVGARLFVRHQRGVSLTPAGIALGKKARILIRQLRELHEDVAVLESEPSGSVYLGMPPSLCEVVSGPVIAEYIRKYPRVRLFVHEGVSNIAEEKLANGDLDIAVLMGERHQRRSSSIRLLANEELVLAGTADVIGATPSISIRDMAEIPLVLYPLPNYVRWQIDVAFHQHAVSPLILAEVDTLQMVLEMARRGVGAAVLPKSAITRDLASNTLNAASIGNLSVKWTLAVSREREKSSAVIAMAKCIEDVARRNVHAGIWRAKLKA